MSDTSAVYGGTYVNPTDSPWPSGYAPGEGPGELQSRGAPSTSPNPAIRALVAAQQARYAAAGWTAPGQPGSGVGQGGGLSGVGSPGISPTVGGTGATPTGGPGLSGAAVNTSGGTVAQQDAMATLNQMLDGYGLGSLAGWAWTELTSGKSVDQIVFDLRQTPTYQQSIFGQTNTLRQKQGLPVMTEQDILNYKNSAQQLFTAAGLPKDFYTSDQELAALMGQDVSAAELAQRVDQGYKAALNGPPEILTALQQLYGVTTGHLAAFFLDPTKAEPLIQKQFSAAQISGTAAQTGYGYLGQSPAEMLAAQGVSVSQAQQGFTQLGQQAQLFQALPGTGEQALGQQVQLGAEFLGNADDQRAVQQRADARKAVFSGGGTYAGSSAGISGTGQAQSA